MNSGVWIGAYIARVEALLPELAATEESRRDEACAERDRLDAALEVVTALYLRRHAASD